MRIGIERKFDMLRPLIIIILFLTVFLTNTVFGQTGTPVEYEIERTEKIIERAQNYISDSGDEQARQYFEKAIFHQDKAYTYFANNNEQNALIHTMRARALAEKATGLVNKNNENQDLVQRELDRTNEILEHAQEYFDLAELDRNLIIYEQARIAQNRANELLLQNQKKMALASTLKARDILEKGLESARLARQAGRELERTAMLMDRAVDMMREMQYGELPGEFDQAKQYQMEAQEYYNTGKFQECYNKTLRARELIVNTIDRAELKAQERNFPKFISNLETKLSGLLVDAGKTQNKRVIRLLDRACDEIDQARESYQKNNIKQGMLHLRRANRFLGDASDFITP